ncbi:hypothetical protein E3C22_15780 [Jiella endophytica]|uniref:Uncharacterized protein n=1 Tax=Jiella endophytica TaxID=2558362 RepID=A0A4Y8RI58_9HYPH|nr:hypothetical protein [Jiella endophytica]TFF22096.1 hypothetical protein E3C22_15780 [Jiella endophytica]
MSGNESEDQREAQRILERVRQETDPQIGAHTQAIFTRTGDHFMARDVDQSDRIEVIGSRIGRIASVAGFVVLALLLASQLLQG